MPSVPVRTAAPAVAVGVGEQPKRFPYEDGTYAAQHLIHEMSPEEFNKMLGLPIKHRGSQAVHTG
ncbi:hypothetical protein [Streptomyces caelestis]|uniref:hypothetical protein n=1 Tax=Streptomyces caelestis TaxID=36816 RepID=UPI00366279B0